MSTTNNRLTAEELQKLRQTDFMGKPGFVKAETLLTKEVGEIGTPQCAEFDAKARAWYYGEMLRERRKELGMTQKELAEHVGRGTDLYQPDRERGNGFAAIFIYPYRGGIGYHNPPRRKSGVGTEQMIITFFLRDYQCYRNNF